MSGVAPALGQIRDAMERAGSHRETPAGTLRLNTSAGAARQMEPIVFEYLRRYPDMTVDIVTEGRLLDIVAEGFDAGVAAGGNGAAGHDRRAAGPGSVFCGGGIAGVFRAASEAADRRPISARHCRCIRQLAAERWHLTTGSSSATRETVAIDGEGPLIPTSPT